MGKGRGRHGKGGEGKEKGNRQEGMRGEAGHPQIFRWINAFGTMYEIVFDSLNSRSCIHSIHYFYVR